MVNLLSSKLSGTRAPIRWAATGVSRNSRCKTVSTTGCQVRDHPLGTRASSAVHPARTVNPASRDLSGGHLSSCGLDRFEFGDVAHRRKMLLNAIDHVAA